MFSFFSSKHSAKIALGAPIMFMFFLGSSGSDQTKNILAFEAPFPEIIDIREATSLSIMVTTSRSVNAVGGIVTYSPGDITLSEISTRDSTIDIWTQYPENSPNEGKVSFSGGYAREGGHTGNAKLFSFTFTPKHTGQIMFDLTDVEILADDGIGTNISTGNFPSKRKIFVYGENQPSPDMNADNKLTLSDANILYMNLFRTYNPKYDLNNDKRTNWADVRYLLTLISD